nr:uncharacterized protein LOC124811573 isoform X1 [Hydra vulgaris]
MRSAQKSTLKTFILNNVSPVKEPVSTKMADGGALLWCCNWKKNELFSEINLYINFAQHLQLDTIIFDGYQSSTKDSIHQKRSGKISQTVEINDLNPCPAERSIFLSNYKNKNDFVRLLALKLQNNGFKVICCPSDADTSIVKLALEINNVESVTIYSDDTDILCLLMHHVHTGAQSQGIFLKTLTRNKATDQRVCYKIQNVVNTSDDTLLNYVLFAHTFTGCDTTSAIHNFGKTTIFTKLKNSNELKSTADLFYQENISTDDIGKGAIRFFELLHSPCFNLKQIRKHKYDEMVASDRASIDPALLPPSPRAAYYHGLRVYHQMKVW